MTGDTGILRIIRRVRMAVLTLIPFALVRPAVYRKILPVVVKGCWYPSRFVVATGTIGREIRPGVIRVDRLIIVANMATRTGIGCISVVALVAACAIVGNNGMRAIERVIIIVYSKRSRRPAVGGVATRTVGRDAQLAVIRIGALVVVRCMAGRTIRRGTGISRAVTIDTGRRHVRTG